ncbi:uncharacterized protein EDB91DRAFT_1128315, partial [Suillus paluster]|uniref:uncharacterized protein n=1 Tax=Suillus paluster TaxID=48578 RepID=UPI001B863A94
MSFVSVPITEQPADLSLADTEHTEITPRERDLGGQEGQGCQHLAEGSQAPPARSCSNSNDLVPLFRVPDEILREILRHGVQMEVDGGGSSFQKTMSHVSMRWRTVAISDPSLWTRVPVCPEETLQFLQTRIHRAVDMPIDVDIHPWPTQLTRFAPHLLLPQLDTIRQCASLWRSLTIRCGKTEQMFSTVLLYFMGHRTFLPSLECVRLYGWDVQVMPWSRALFFDERCTPRISTLKVDNIKICTGSLDSQNSRITTLILTRDAKAEMVTTAPKDFFRVPSSFSLASLVIHGLVVDIPYVSSTDGHQYSTLRTLDIHGINCARFSPLTFTLALMFPGVTHLNLTGPRAAPSLLEAVRRVSADEIWPGLQKLVLNGFVAHEWSQIHRYLQTYNRGDCEV